MTPTILTEDQAVKRGLVRVTEIYVRSEHSLLERAVETYGVDKCALVPAGKGYTIWRPGSLVKKGGED